MNKTNKLWFFEDWKNSYQELSCIAAKEWMKLFNKYENNPEDAEMFWEFILKNTKIKIDKL